MAKVVAITDAVKSLADIEAWFNLQRHQEPQFFTEWVGPFPDLTHAEIAALDILYRRLDYHRADGDLLEGAVTLLVASPLLEIAGFYDPPFRMKVEASVALTVDDGEETLRGRIDILILQAHLWALVLESKKTTISLRSALPQVLVYMMANPQWADQPLFGCLTNGDDVIFIKLTNETPSQYGLSRAFSLYTDKSELMTVLQILKRLQQIVS